MDETTDATIPKIFARIIWIILQGRKHSSYRAKHEHTSLGSQVFWGIEDGVILVESAVLYTRTVIIKHNVHLDKDSTVSLFASRALARSV